jgi:hypothetical protein
VLEDRPVAASDADDAVREAAFSGWPASARVCRIADLDNEVASCPGSPASDRTYRK